MDDMMEAFSSYQDRYREVFGTDPPSHLTKNQMKQHTRAELERRKVSAMDGKTFFVGVALGPQGGVVSNAISQPFASQEEAVKWSHDYLARNANTTKTAVLKGLFECERTAPPIAIRELKDEPPKFLDF